MCSSPDLKEGVGLTQNGFEVPFPLQTVAFKPAKTENLSPSPIFAGPGDSASPGPLRAIYAPWLPSARL